MKKNLKIFASVFLLSGFLVACADGEQQEQQEQPANPDVPNEQMPEDGGEMEPGTGTNEGL